MKLNHVIKSFRVSKELEEALNKASNELGFKKTDLVRFLLNRAIKQLESAANKAGGFSNLEFSLKL